LQMAQTIPEESTPPHDPRAGCGGDGKVTEEYDSAIREFQKNHRTCPRLA